MNLIRTPKNSHPPALAGVGFLAGSHRNAIRRDRLLPVRTDVCRIRTPCGRAEALRKKPTRERPPCPSLPLGYALPTHRGGGSLRLAQNKICSVCLGGKAAQTNRTYYRPLIACLNKFLSPIPCPCVTIFSNFPNVAQTLMSGLLIVITDGLLTRSVT